MTALSVTMKDAILRAAKNEYDGVAQVTAGTHTKHALIVRGLAQVEALGYLYQGRRIVTGHRVVLTDAGRRAAAV